MKALLLVVFVNFVGIGALIPVIPYAVVDVGGGNATVMSWLLACFSIFMFIGSPILGSLSDRYGRKGILIGSILVSALAHALFAISDNLVLMFASRVLAGFAAGNFSVIQAIITDNTGEEQRARAMGMVGAFVGLGLVAGPALGGLLSDTGGHVHTAPFLLAAALALAGALLCMASVRETAPRGPSGHARPPLAERWRAMVALGLAGFAVASVLMNLGFAQVEVSFVLALKDTLGYSSFDTGWIFVWIGALIVLIQGTMIGPVAKRLTDIGTALAGSIVLAIGGFSTVLLIGAGFVLMGSELAGVLLSSALIVAGFAFINPTIASAASKRARDGEIGGSLGIVHGCGSLGQVGGLLLGGPLYEMGGGELTFLVSAAVTVALSICLFAILIGSKRVRAA